MSLQLPENTTPLSIVLWCWAQVSYIISINVIEVYDIAFKTLSMVSLIIIISINLKKHWKDFAGVRKKFFKWFK